MAPPKRQFSLRHAAPRWWLVLLALVGLSAFTYLRRDVSDSAPTLEPARFSGDTMGTTYSVLLGAPPERSAQEQLQREVDALLVSINQSMSTYDPDSELSRFNRHASTAPFPVSAELAEVVRMALAVSQASEGAFDVTVGPLVTAWGFGPRGRPLHQLTDEEVSALRERVGFEKLTVVGDALQKTHPRLEVDLSAIAKGYGVDRVASLLEQRGHKDYLVEIGGELRARGKNARQKPFRVGVEVPQAEARRAYTAVALGDQAMATSGNYRNVFELDGQRVAHTLDPRTGRPTHHTLLSVSVLHESTALADAWATALMAAGPERAFVLAEREGLSVLLLIAGEGDTLEERSTQGFEARRVGPGPG